MQSNSITGISVKTLQRAVKIRTRIDKLQATLSALLEGRAKVGGTGGAPGRRKKRRMSAAAKAKISAAAKKRWKAFRASKGKA